MRCTHPKCEPRKPASQRTLRSPDLLRKKERESLRALHEELLLQLIGMHCRWLSDAYTQLFGNEEVGGQRAKHQDGGDDVQRC